MDDWCGLKFGSSQIFKNFSKCWLLLRFVAFWDAICGLIVIGDNAKPKGLQLGRNAILQVLPVWRPANRNFCRTEKNGEITPPKSKQHIIHYYIYGFENNKL